MTNQNKLPTITNSELSKNSTEEVKFKPTASMRLWVATSIDLVSDNVSRISKECGVDRKNWYIWLKKPGFLEWFDQERERNMTLIRHKLDNIGLQKAKTDFRYFELMQRVAGRNTSDDKDEKSPGVQVNFNANKFIKNR